ncbi:MAG: prenyltransferase [Chloroflexi bacterium]|nr:prenyltransferase [Chloroflexota bacterium]
MSLDAAPSGIKLWFLETRPHFLLITPASVLLGAAAALYDTGHVDIFRLFLSLAGALLAHISVNVLNDYYDFKSGIDLRTKRTPFSGGSGILPAGLLTPPEVLFFGLASLLALLPIGLYFALTVGWGMIPIGISGMLLVYFYTTSITRRPILCLLAPGLGFGLAMVLGTYYAQTGAISSAALLTSLVPGFLISNLLLINQFPDVEADKIAERRHLPIVLGRKSSAKVYVALFSAMYASIVLSVAFGALPPAAIAGVLTLPLGVKAMKGALNYHNDMDRLIPVLVTNVKVTLLTPLLVGIPMMVSSMLLQTAVR